ncbi:MAG: hypothetical protein KDM64_11835, partial [Verrucomicrobiae bacterium]|nr:hypothetical protein [Verrucomicrobiae bacterium]
MKLPAHSLALVIALGAILGNPAPLRSQTTQITKLFAKGLPVQSGAAFGVDVAMSPRWIVVGEPFRKVNNIAIGAVHVFDTKTQRFQRNIICPEVSNFEIFGVSISIEGDRALIGAPGFPNGGRAHLFNLRTGALLHTFFAPFLGNSQFGTAVALTPTQVVISDPAFTENAVKSGGIFVYPIEDLDATPDTLIPADAAAGDEWGISLSVAGNLLVGGARKHNANAGAAYLFDLDSKTQLRKFAGSGAELAGTSVAIAGGRVAVGAPGATVNGADSGQVLLFQADNGALIDQLLADDGGLDHLLGYSLAASHDLIVAGAPGHPAAGGAIEAGAAYVFDARSGKQLRRLLAPGRTKNDLGGIRVAVMGQKVLMGNYGSDEMDNATGSAVLFSPVAGRLSLTPLGSRGDAAPGLADAQQVAFGDAVINQTSRTAFVSRIAGPGASGGKNVVAYSSVAFPETPEMIMQSGPGNPLFSGQVTGFGRPLMNEAPTAFFQVAFRPLGSKGPTL